MILETLLIVGSVTMIMLIMMLKVRDHCHIAEKYRGSEHKDWNYLIMQELGKFNLKIKDIPNRLEKHMSCTINNKLTFIDSF